VNKKFKYLPKTKVTTKSKILGILFLLFFYLGTYITIMAMDIFEVIIINSLLLLCIWLTTGLIILPFTHKLLKEEGKKSYLFWQWLFNCITFGGIITYSFLTLNNHFLNDTSSKYKLLIKEKGYNYHRGHCRNSYVNVDIKGTEKQIIFSCETKIDNSKHLNIVIQKGLFGFDVITNKTLSNE
jgi:hypothetical protein